MKDMQDQESSTGRLHVRTERAGGKLNLIKIVTGIPTQAYKDNWEEAFGNYKPKNK